MNTYIYKTRKIPIEVIKKNNKNTYLRIKNGTIVITTNYFTRQKQIDKLVNNNKDFIDKMLCKDEEKNKEESFKLFGRSYDIIFGFNDTEIDENKIYTKDKKSLDKYLLKYVYNIYEERLSYWYNVIEETIPFPNLKIRTMTSRWGVCNLKNNNVTLNFELSKYDIECLDYVIVHELSHFLYPNHSKFFWLQVAKYYPDYKNVRKKLKQS